MPRLYQCRYLKGNTEFHFHEFPCGGKLKSVWIQTAIYTQLCFLKYRTRLLQNPLWHFSLASHWTNANQSEIRLCFQNGQGRWKSSGWRRDVWPHPPHLPSAHLLRVVPGPVVSISSPALHVLSLVPPGEMQTRTELLRNASLFKKVSWKIGWCWGTDFIFPFCWG